MNETFNSYAQILAYFQPCRDDVDALLDPAQGMSAKFRLIVQHQLEDAQDPQRDYDLAESELDALKLEYDTWSLIQELYGQRLSAPYQGPTPHESLSSNPYLPTATIAQIIMQLSKGLNELRVVREWLQDSAPRPQVVEHRLGYWAFTRLQLVHSKRSGKAVSGSKLVRELDPDAINRANSGSLDPDDAAYEKVFTQALYSYVRAGMHEEAMALCSSSGRPWRAATLRGGIMFSWPALAGNPDRDADTSMRNPNDSMALDGTASSWRGNRRRKLFQETCSKASSNPNLSLADRALYASLSPSIRTLPALLPLCRTWEDHLWARVIVLGEERMNQVMDRLTGGHGPFWESESVEVPLDGVDIADDEPAWYEEVQKTLGSLAEIGVEEGPGARDAFHRAQLLIILDRTDELVEEFASSLFQPGAQPPHLIRFFAHLCLFLRLVQQEAPLEAAHKIVDAYVGVLEADGQTDLVALYASSLGNDAVSRYALFLSGLDIRMDPADRRAALLRAQEYGLDVAQVAFATAKLTADKAFRNLPPLTRPLPSIISLQKDPLSATEVALIRSVEWLVVIQETYFDALRQSNAILRYFLCLGKVQASQMVLANLPTDLAAHAIDPSSGESAEHMHYRDFFQLWDMFGNVYDLAGEEVRVMGAPGSTKQGLGAGGFDRDTQVKWLREYSDMIEKLQEQTIRLLESDWLTTDQEEEQELGTFDESRRNELTRIRQIYIPELIIRLHAILYNSRERFPTNIKAALELCNIVADSRYKLYYDFISEDENKLGTYLRAVRGAVLAGLDVAGSGSGGGTTSDPFRIMVG